MEITSSYGVEIRQQNICLRKTLDVYRRAIRWLIPVFDGCWEELSCISDAERQFNKAEHLVHTTRKNKAHFDDFDRLFPKMPSYLRRSAVKFALGAVSSYRTRLAAWEAEPKGKHEKGKPRLQEWNAAMPVFYRDNMYKACEEDEDAAWLKLYDGHDWVWCKVRLLHTDMQYLRKHWTGKEASAPTLVRRHKKYFLRFAFSEQVKLCDERVDEQVICSVDLGINTDAVCTVMRSNGTILGRKFIDFPGDKDRLYRILGRIKRHQSEHGPSGVESLWRLAMRQSDELARKTAGAITAYAVSKGADVIVFEYLDMKCRIRGSRRQRLHLWRKRGIQEMCEHQAHRAGLRVSRICAWGTSALAYDGSGRVVRDANNHSLCTFTTGKRYNCDLSASYNIGARYFIREILKTLPETARSLLGAKVPAVKRRTSCVYADLLALINAKSALKAAKKHRR